MEVEAVVVVATGAALGGVVVGLAGFGNALAALGVWLLVLPPKVAVPLVAVCSCSAHLASLPEALRQTSWRQTLPIVLAGLAGVPLGVWLVSVVDIETSKRIIGLAVLVAVLAIAALQVRATGSQETIHRRVTLASLIGVGAVGGVLGGLAGLSGAPLVAWAQLLGWDKAIQRSFFQIYNFSILSVALVVHLLAGAATWTFMLACLVAVPLSLAGAVVGRRLFGYVDQQAFRLIVLTLLMLLALRLVVWG